MINRFAKTAAALYFLASVFASTNGWSATNLYGSGELAYTKYDASERGRDVFNGSSLVQKYSLTYTTTNLHYRNQPRYYNLMVGYDLVDFNTKITEPTQQTSIKQGFGKLKYSGEVGYNASELPVRFKAYINDRQHLSLKSGISPFGLINDELTYSLEGRGMSISSGAYFAFEPETSRNASLRALPKVFLEYRDTRNKSSEASYRVDSRLQELAVAGLNKENNWLNYRLMDYENYLQPLDNFRRQQIQIGLVDHRGRRLWSSLTNWIEVSADAQLTEVKSPSAASNLEEYDVNFMAIAKRQNWNARTFMNYNRRLDEIALAEVASVPVYIKGIYGPETDWYVSMGVTRGRENLLAGLTTDTSSTNSLSVGATTFSRSKFTLSPSINLATSKVFRGYDAQSADFNLDTASTRRFSSTLGLGSRLTFRVMDDGAGTANSKTWSSKLDLTATYRPNSMVAYRVQDTIDSGNGVGFIDPNRLQTASAAINFKSYLRNYISASAGWTPNARFATSLEGTYDVIMPADLPENREMSVTYKASYDAKVVSYKLDSKYTSKNNGFTVNTGLWNSSVYTQYRPDRYNDGLLRLTYQKETGLYSTGTKMELLQRYSYNFFALNGVVRNFATLTEEYAITKSDNQFASTDVQHLMLSGRYSPTERYSLFGSAKYEKATFPDSVTMYYNAGVTTDFRLLSTSIEYTLAKRDVDNRIEKKLAASVRRTF